MFRGIYEHTIDSKGRIIIPAKFKEILQKEYDHRLVISNYDHCLAAFPYREWALIEKEMETLPLLGRERRIFSRFFYSSGIDCMIDKQGRLLIPHSLRQFANLQREVVLVGGGRLIEIWNKERWVEAFRKSQEDFDQVTDKLSEMGFGRPR